MFKNRYETLRIFFEAGQNRHNVYRLEEHRLPEAWSVSIRSETGHWTSPIFGNEAELKAYLRRMERERIWRGDKLIVGYTDVRSPDGLNRKYSAYRIGERIVPAHLMISDGWRVQVREGVCDVMMENPHLITEEQSFIDGNPMPTSSCPSFGVSAWSTVALTIVCSAIGSRIGKSTSRPPC